MREIREAKILFINEDPDEYKLVQIFLRERRHDTIVSCDPKTQSLSDFVKQQPDLILITAQPWSFDSFQIYKELRTFPEFEKTPIIFLRFVQTSAEFYPM